ncbi:MAG: hypothetical protein HQ508_05945 [Candidatus Marinimicrobia bacterium]|nr:hypothetical protein [Candidatus Neomarinimicrobiota bacterium]
MKNKKRIFTIIAALLPIFVLAILELSLWLLDAYPQPPLFIDVKERGIDFVQINSAVGERYFNKNIMPVPNLFPQIFPARKGKNTLRIFCLGGSTTGGFPYEMTVPFPQQLKMLLNQDYPDREFEVINLGLSAINSFTVVDWIPEVLEQEPDLILLYMGHNEFYGAYGTGSTISFGNNPRVTRAILKLQKLRLVQFINSTVQKLSNPPPANKSPTLMEKVIADKFIPGNSILRMKTQENFGSNLDVILNACQSSGVPVILSDLVSNIRDQTPLDVTSNPGNEGSRAYELYQKGLNEFQQGDTATAYISLSRAMNADEVPFRANNNINDILHEKAVQFKVPIVNMESAFRAASLSGIPGNELFCDHLHPNPIGYHLMANQFNAAIDKMTILPAKAPSALAKGPLFVTDLDWEIGSLHIFKLINRWPFGNRDVDYSEYSATIDENTARIAKSFLLDHHIWGKAHSEMADVYLAQADLQRAGAEYMAILEMYPEKIEYYEKLVDCAMQTQQWELAKQTCLKALPKTTAKGMFYFNLALSHKANGELSPAIMYTQKAIEAPELSRSQSTNIYFTYALLLLDAKKNMDAILVLEALVVEVPDFAQAQKLLKRLKG